MKEVFTSFSQVEIVKTLHSKLYLRKSIFHQSVFKVSQEIILVMQNVLFQTLIVFIIGLLLPMHEYVSSILMLLLALILSILHE